MLRIGKYFFGLGMIILFFLSCKNDKVDVSSGSTGNATLDQLNELIQKNPEDKKLYFERAVFLYENQSFDGAISDLKKAISIDSLVPEFYHLLSDTYMDYFKSKDALLTMETCTKLFPERIPSLLKLSETELILKQYENSLSTCSRILTLNSQNAEAYFMMGMNLKSMPDLKRAKVAFRKATEIDPELVDAWIILGQILEEEGDAKAIDYFEAATNVDGENPQTWHSKAFYLQNNGKEKEAIDIYTKINSMDKNYIDAYLNAGILHLSMDSLDQAYNQFNILVNIKPEFYLGHYYRGIVNEMKGQTDNAKTDYQTALHLNSKFSKAKTALYEIEKKIKSE